MVYEVHLMHHAHASDVLGKNHPDTSKGGVSAYKQHAQLRLCLSIFPTPGLKLLVGSSFR